MKRVGQEQGRALTEISRQEQFLSLNLKFQEN